MKMVTLKWKPIILYIHAITILILGERMDEHHNYNEGERLINMNEMWL